MKVYEVTKPQDGTGYYSDEGLHATLALVAEDLEEGRSDSLTITVMEMSEDDFNALPEFEGW